MLPTVDEITNWFLYGQSSTPTNKVSDQWIRNTEPSPFSIDRGEYMSSVTGPGRFANASRFELVKRFFDSTELPVGIYTKQQIAPLLSLDASDPNYDRLSITQALYRDGYDDYGERTYNYNSGLFGINADATFIVAGDGTRAISSFSVRPYFDNFDFDSDSLIAMIGNPGLYDAIDPSKIGKTYEIAFSGDVQTVAYTRTDYVADQATVAGWQGIGALNTELAEVAGGLWENGVTKFLDPDNRPIVYGTNSGDTLDAGDINGSIWADLYSVPTIDDSEYSDNGIVLIGGGGGDSLTGSNKDDSILGGDAGDFLVGADGKDTLEGGDGEDELRGGEGDDSLLGGDGQDRYIFFGDYGNDTIEDSDGSGRIVIDGDTLSGSFEEEDDRGGVQWWIGTETSHRGVILKSGSTIQIYHADAEGNYDENFITIKNFNNDGGFGFTLVGAPTPDDDDNPNVPNVPEDPDNGVPGFNPANDGFDDFFDHPPASPLIIDYNRNGQIELTAYADNSRSFFDIDGDGFVEQTGWVQSGDALLARDINGNGIIDDITELFGNETTDGFIHLAALDSNSDNIINSNDAVFGELLIWRDLNGNGYSNAGELQGLADAGIASISLNYTTVNGTNQGHDVSTESTVTFSDSATAKIQDIWFQHNQAHSFYVKPEGFFYDTDVFELPQLRGSGNVADLWVAMTQDSSLKAQMQGLANADYSNFNFATFAGSVESILFRWAGVDAVHPNSRGDYIDARVLEAVENLIDRDYQQTSGYGSGGDEPRVNSGAALTYLWEQHVNDTAAKLLTQIDTDNTMLATHNANLSYNFIQDKLDGDFQGFIDAIVLEQPSSSSAKLIYWQDFLPFINIAANTLSVTDADYTTALTGTYLDTITSDPLATLRADNSQVLIGTDAAETITGGGTRDYLVGGKGNDRLEGLGGEDIYGYFIGDGNDTIADNGTIGDRLLFGPDVDLNDLSFSRSGSDSHGGSDLLISISGGGSVLIEDQFNQSNAAVDLIQVDNGESMSPAQIRALILAQETTSGNDTIYGFRYSDDVINGGDGDDVIYGGSTHQGNDTLNGGAGNDTMYGGNGNNVYIVDQVGDVVQTGFYSGPNERIEASVSYALPSGVETLQLTGTANINGWGTTGDDTLIGNSGNNRLEVGPGNDLVFGGAGVDTIDFYSFGYPQFGNNTISGGEAILLRNGYLSGEASYDSGLGVYSLNTTTIEQTASGLLITANTSSMTGSILITDWNEATYNYGFTLEDTGSGNNDPTLANAIADQNATEGSGFNFQFAANTFSDVDAGDTLSYSATKSDGSALPAWLSFNASTRTFSGTPLDANVGVIVVKVTASDGHGGTPATDIFNITVADINNAPTVANAIANQNATEDAVFSFQFASDVFADVDAGDTLAYSATLGSGGALPSWLSFNTSTRTFSGTPDTGDVGTIAVKVTANDGNGGTVDDVFDLVVAAATPPGNPITGTNSGETLNGTSGADYITALGGNDDIFAGGGNDTVSSGAGDDYIELGAGNDVILLTLTDSSSATGVDYVGDFAQGQDRLDVSAMGYTDVSDFSVYQDSGYTEIYDSSNGFAIGFDSGTLTLTNADFIFAGGGAPNNDPALANAIADQNATEGSAFSFQFASNTFSDADAGDTLTYSATLSNDAALPSWLAFNASTRTFSGTPLDAHTGAISIKVAASDGHGGTPATDIFMITVADINNAPTVANAIANQNATEDSAFNFQFATNVFADLDAGDTLTYSATLNSGSALPSWLSFSASTRTFSGTPDSGDVGTHVIKVTANDGNGGTVDDVFDLVVQSGGPTFDNTVTGSSGNNTLTGTSGNDLMNGLGGHDNINGGSGHDSMDGGTGNDTIYGWTGNDTLIGGDGDDELGGDDGDDLIVGGNGNDDMFGWTGNDTLIGGAGGDYLEGGDGIDIFTYTSLSDSTAAQTDYIGDFVHGTDKIDLSGLGFTGIQSGAASGATLGYTFGGGYSEISNSAGTFFIGFNGNLTFDSGDFIFS